MVAVGERFFDINFREGAYGSVGREFEMSLEEDLAISGVAKVTVPTSVMKIFGFAEVPLVVNCEAKINFSNTDYVGTRHHRIDAKRTPAIQQAGIEALRSCC